LTVFLSASLLTLREKMSTSAMSESKTELLFSVVAVTLASLICNPEASSFTLATRLMNLDSPCSMKPRSQDTRRPDRLPLLSSET